MSKKLDYNIDNLYPNTIPESMDESNPSFQNTFSEGVGSAINAGQFIGNTTVEDGYLQSSNFVTGSAGWRLSPTTAELNVSTALASLDIPDTTTANSFHVDSSGNAWWGTNVATGYATAPGSVLATGAATFSSMTITGGSITGTPIASIPNSTATDISLLGWQHDMAFTPTDHDTVAWASGTITLSNGRTFSITGSNTGTMAAITYIYLDTGVSSIALQNTTTAATAVGANKILICVAQNVTSGKDAIYQVFGGKALGGVGVLLTADHLTAQTITTNEIAANTIVGGNISTMSISGKTVLFDTGTIGGWTLSATRLSAGSAGTTVGMDTTVTGGDDIRIFAGSATMASAPFRVTEAGAMTATSATITGSVTATSGAIGGWTINSTSITDAAGVVGMSSAVTGGDDIRFWAGDATPASAEFRVTEAGALTATSATITGALTATSGAIGGWTINSTSIYTGTEDHTTYTTNSGDVTLYSTGTDASLHMFNTYIDTTGKIFTKSAAIGGWTIDATSIYTGTEDHSGYTANAGDITLYSNGTDASIHAKNWYIDTAGVLTATAVVVDGALTAGASSAINVQYLTAGTISSKSIVLAITAGTGDAEIRAGIATGDFSNAGAANGFIIGLDDSDSDKVKFYFGNATRNVVFDGTDLTVNGYLVATQGSFGGDGSDGAFAITSGTTTISIASAKTLVKNYTSISITSTGKLAFSNPATTGSSVMLKSQGNVTITSGATCIDFSGLGSSGGAAETDGTTADTGFLLKTDGGGGSTGLTGTGGTGFSIISAISIDASSWFRYPNAVLGAGGGGGDSSGDTGGTGGRGGGVGIIECGGAWNFTTASGISVAGVVGGDGSGGGVGSGGGGGGGGGYFVALYKTLTASSGTVVITGGAGGEGTNGGTGSGGGGAGAAGAGSDAVDADTGGAGASGFSLIAQNKTF